jgi:phage terminase small subunit
VNARQRRFVEEYLIDLNATDAAKRAGYSAKTAYSIGQRLLKDVEISEAVADAEKARAERVQITADEILSELAILCRSDVRHFSVDDRGTLELTEGAPNHAWRAVASVKHKVTSHGEGEDAYTTREIEYRLWDKNTALRNAGQHLGMFVERTDITSGDKPVAFTFRIDSPSGDSVS